MSPQRSNRMSLVEGTLRCLERLPPEQVTARAIAAESGANLGSITYHFGSKDNLVTAAVVEGLDRWLADIAERLANLPAGSPEARLLHAAAVIESTGDRRRGLARNFVSALAKAQHDGEVSQLLAEGFRRTRYDVAAVIGLGDDPAGAHAGALVLAMFHGLLLQTMLDEDLGIHGAAMSAALARLREALPEPSRSGADHADGDVRHRSRSAQ